MSLPPNDGHERWTELAAGYALDALDDAEAREFTEHLAARPDCLPAVSDFTEAAGSLSAAAGPERPSDALRGRILAEATAAPARLGTARWRRVAAAAAVALVVGLAAGVVAGRLAGGTPQPEIQCAHTAGCHTVALQNSSGQVLGKALVQRGHVVLVLDGLAANDRATHTYVLWQIPAGGAPQAVSGFDVGAQGVAVIEAGSLVVPYDDTKALAISLEKGRTPPPAPSTPVAQGAV